MSIDNYTTTILNISNKNSSSGRNNVIRYRLATPINLRDYDISLASLQVYYSWQNIKSSYNNNSLSYRWYDGNYFTVTFPDGMYSFDDMNGFLQSVMYSNGHYLLDDTGSPYYFLSLTANTIYYRVTLSATKIPTVLPTGWSNPNSISLTGTTIQLSVPATNIRTVLGFTDGLYPTAPQTSDYSVNGQNVPQISIVNAVSVQTNLIASSFFNSSQNSIFVFSPDKGFGQLLSIAPTNLLWYRALDTVFNDIEIRLTDQDNNDLDMLDPVFIVSLYLRKRI
jgi:hypothetical protein